MKLNPKQLEVLNAVKNAGKATYEQATAAGGNGRTVAALTVKGFLTENPPTKKVAHPTWSLTAEGKKALKAAAKVA